MRLLLKRSLPGRREPELAGGLRDQRRRHGDADDVAAEHHGRVELPLPRNAGGPDPAGDRRGQNPVLHRRARETQGVCGAARDRYRRKRCRGRAQALRLRGGGLPPVHPRTEPDRGAARPGGAKRGLEEAQPLPGRDLRGDDRRYRLHPDECRRLVRESCHAGDASRCRDGLPEPDRA